MRLGPLLLSVVAIALALAPAASADKPYREVSPQGDFTVDDQCAFPVLGHVDGNEIDTLHFDRLGDPVKQIVVFPGNTVTFTNATTGKSVTVQGTGSFQRRGNPDGSEEDDVTGHGLFAPNPLTGDPGIWSLNGHASATMDAAGNQTSVEVAGKLVDLCDQLAP